MLQHGWVTFLPIICLYCKCKGQNTTICLMKGYGIMTQSILQITTKFVTNGFCSFLLQTSASHLFLITYLLTYSMEHSPSWEANRFSASQEIPTFYWTRSFNTTFTSARQLSISWVSSIQSIAPHPTSWSSVLILSSPYIWVIQVVIFPRVSPPNPLTGLSSFPYVLHTPPTSFFSILSPEQYWVRSTYH